MSRTEDEKDVDGKEDDEDADEKEEINANDSGGSGDKSNLGANAAVKEEEAAVGEAAGNAEDEALFKSTDGC